MQLFFNIVEKKTFKQINHFRYRAQQLAHGEVLRNLILDAVAHDNMLPLKILNKPVHLDGRKSARNFKSMRSACLSLIVTVTPLPEILTEVSVRSVSIRELRVTSHRALRYILPRIFELGTRYRRFHSVSTLHHYKYKFVSFTYSQTRELCHVS